VDEDFKTISPMKKEPCTQENSQVQEAANESSINNWVHAMFDVGSKY
jgi:hypothetical protein